MNDIKVSILCTTYNHERFIKDALDSFLSQKVDFKTEILIHDDCSTDGTLRILKKYANKNKNIRLFTEQKNQYSKNNFKFINELYESAKGEYIAFCEGDDYWIDDNKIQKQVDYLDKKPNYSLCFHPVRVVFENTEHQEYIYPEPNSIKQYSTFELLKRNYIQTNSVLYRRRNYDNLPNNIVPSDWYMHLYHAACGKIGFINKVMSVYRRHEDGVWWDSTDNTDNIWNKYGLGHINLFHEQLKLLGSNKSYHDVIYNNLMNLLFNIFGGKTVERELHNKINKKYPEYIIEYAKSNTAKIVELEKIKLSLDQEIVKMKTEKKARMEQIKILEENINNNEKELNEIKKSKAWKVVQNFRKIKQSLRT